MRKSILTISLLLLVLGVAVVTAADLQPGTPQDNECYPGGVLYREDNQDGCPTEWHWKAGWFLARYNRELITREQFPDEFASVLPDLEDAPVKTICHVGTSGTTVWSTICISSDQSGTWTGINPGGVGTYGHILMFVDNIVDCPPTYKGGAFNGGGASAVLIHFHGFTIEEFAELGIKDGLCFYDAV